MSRETKMGGDEERFVRIKDEQRSIKMAKMSEPRKGRESSIGEAGQQRAG
jgi:hypothetical protein